MAKLEDVKRKVVSTALLGSLLAVGGSAFIAPTAYAASWDDEEIVEEEIPEGMDLFDSTSEQVSRATGSSVDMRSITSPDLFNNIDEDFRVEWDVLIRPEENESSHERTYVSLTYDSDFDANIEIQRCEEPYGIDPNNRSDNNTRSCEGQSQSWDTVEINASQYISGAETTVEVGSFLLQNNAYLRFTVVPSTSASINQGSDGIDLTVSAEVNDEIVSVGNSGYSNVESVRNEIVSTPSSSPSPSETDAGDSEIENEEIPQPTEDSPSAEPTPSTPAVNDDENEEENSVITENLTYIIIAGILIIATIVFFVMRKRNQEDEVEDEYLDDDEEEYGDEEEDGIYV